jgi:hypothetical protein
LDLGAAVVVVVLDLVQGLVLVLLRDQVQDQGLLELALKQVPMQGLMLAQEPAQEQVLKQAHMQVLMLGQGQGLLEPVLKLVPMQVLMLDQGLPELVLKLVHMQGLVQDHMPVVMESRIIHIYIIRLHYVMINDKYNSN